MALVSRINWAERQPGDIVAYRGHTGVSIPIEIMERFGREGKGDFVPSHIAGVARDRNQYLEACWPRVRLAWATEYPLHDIKVYRLNADAAKKAAALALITERYLGKRYDLVGVIAFVAIEIARHFGRSLPNEIARGSWEWCSELWARFVDTIIPLALQAKETNPAGLMDWLEENV